MLCAGATVLLPLHSYHSLVCNPVAVHDALGAAGT